jgi:hypothetical protein
MPKPMRMIYWPMEAAVTVEAISSSKGDLENLCVGETILLRSETDEAKRTIAKVERNGPSIRIEFAKLARQGQ